MDELIARDGEVNVSRVPTIVFGHKALMFWGTIAFMVIEGWTLALTVLSYFYLRQNFHDWPPLRTPKPSLLVPSINVAVLLVSLIPSWWTDRRAKEFDHDGVRLGLAITGAFGIVALVLRWFDFWAINTRWDTTAYGSVAWLIVGLHASLLLVDVGDTIGLGVIFRRRDLPAHYYSDASDNTMYWYFTVLGWLPLYFIVYVGPYLF